jgi:hypothetical protein
LEGWFLLRRDGAAVFRLQDGALEGPVPIPLGICDGKGYWATSKTEIWVTAELDLNRGDVMALLNEAKNKKRLRLQKAHDLQAMAERLDQAGRRQTIPTAIKTAVWRRDEGKCVACSSTHNLEFDHDIPLSMGGSNTERNLQLLCADCNRRKGATLGGEDAAGRI